MLEWNDRKVSITVYENVCMWEMCSMCPRSKNRITIAVSHRSSTIFRFSISKTTATIVESWEEHSKENENDRVWAIRFRRTHFFR